MKNDDLNNNVCNALNAESSFSIKYFILIFLKYALRALSATKSFLRNFILRFCNDLKISA